MLDRKSPISLSFLLPRFPSLSLSLSFSLTYPLEHHERAEAQTLLHEPLHHSAVSADGDEGLASLHALVHPLHLLLSRTQHLLCRCLSPYTYTCPWVKRAYHDNIFRIMRPNNQQGSYPLSLPLSMCSRAIKRTHPRASPPLACVLCAYCGTTRTTK